MLPRSAHAEHEAGHLVQTAAGLHFVGVPFDWELFHAGEGRRRIPLPAHPFQKERCWIEPGGHAPPATSRKPESEWFYLPGWRRSVPPQLNRSAAAGAWLLAGSGGQPLPRALASLMRESQAEVMELPAWPESVTEWREAIQAFASKSARHRPFRGERRDRGDAFHHRTCPGPARRAGDISAGDARIAPRERDRAARAGALAGKRCFTSPSAGRWGGCRPEY